MWVRAFPRRALVRIWWLLLSGSFVVGTADLLFGGEPTRLPDTGRMNPLAIVVPSLAGAFGVVLAGTVLAAVRRPYVAADAEALRLRPGIGRTLVLPWQRVAELTLVPIRRRALLLVRCAEAGPDTAPGGARPHWWDQGVLRDARQLRSVEPLNDYDVAIYLDDFVGVPYDLLESLEPYAPDHVLLIDKLD
ncbi:hypothetical protein GCM10009681_26830 [Luedemannella helvata]|uniref:Uncharacterized protein n=1 Tax=Luedemannella helvata TaxID=349315 RepID=A0ABP4WGI5_9ACTN